MSETDLVKEILLGIGREFPMVRAWRQNTGAVKIKGQFVKFGVPGQADISGILDTGHRLEIEVKSPGGQQSVEQIRFQQMIESHNGCYVLARSWQEVHDQLIKIISPF